MTNISFDNPLLLLAIIPAAAIIIVPFFLIRNKDNKTLGWNLSLCLHLAIVLLVSLAVAGICSTSILTKTSVYVLADVSYSSDRNLDEIDGYIQDINESLPINSRLGIVCFGNNPVILTSLGRPIRSVKEAKVDNTGTDIVGALDYVGNLFKDDSIKRVVLITDGNDTAGHEPGELAAAVARLTDAGVKIDTIFLDNSLTENEVEAQVTDVSVDSTVYLGRKSQAKILLQTSVPMGVRLEIFGRSMTEQDSEFESITHSIELLEAGMTTVTVDLPTTHPDSYEYKAVVTADGDISSYNNEYLFTQTIVGKPQILLITGESKDKTEVEQFYGNSADIDSYLVTPSNNNVPFTIEHLIKYDEIVISNVDIRNINNINALIDSLDIVIAQYGKSLLTMGDLNLQSDQEDPIFKKFTELLPITYGSASQEGRLYTIVLDVSHSMFYAMKHTIAKEAAIKLLSVMDGNDYVSLVTFSGQVHVHTPALVKNCREDLVNYINSLSTEHGTDIGLGLEEALKTVQTLNLKENRIMLISDGFSFDDTVSAVSAAKKLANAGAVLSTICTYIPSDGDGGLAAMQEIAATSKGGKCYQVQRPSDVSGLVFGTLSNDVTQALVNVSSTVNIDMYKDDVVKGITSLPNVSKYIQSAKKYDAVVPLSVNYIRPSGYSQAVPLYAYRTHGNGRVASFTSSLTGNWCSQWGVENRKALLSNIFVSNTPDNRTDAPYTVNVSYDSHEAYIEILPAVLNPKAVTTITIIRPDGIKSTRTLVFDSQKFSYTFNTEQAGTYTVNITYSYDEEKFSSSVSFVMPYLPEYDAFANFDKSVVYKFMRGAGTITENGIPNLENDKNEIATYKRSYVIPLLIAAGALFITDVAIRKLKITKKRKNNTERKENG